MRLRRKLRAPMVEIVRLEPGDTLVLEFDRQLTAQEANNISSKVSESLDGITVMVFTDPVKLRAVRRAPGVSETHTDPKEAP